MQAHQQSRQTYGSPRVMCWRYERGPACGRHRSARFMRGAGLRQRPRRRFRIRLTDSDHDLPVAPNRVMGQPPPEKAAAVWVADIIYVDTMEGGLYVAGVLDRHSRRGVGWAMDDPLATSLPLAALDMALTHRRPPQGLVLHSDRGVQYASTAYRQRLATAGVRPSMSRRGKRRRQRRQGELLEHPQAQADPPPRVPNPRRHLRGDRSLRQP